MNSKPVLVAFWARRKSLDSALHVEADRKLVPTLSWPHLVALGIGAIIGTGIYTLTVTSFTPSTSNEGMTFGFINSSQSINGNLSATTAPAYVSIGGGQGPSNGFR